MKYLYGASVQGIQGFIFATNRLKEIVGASDIVEEIATRFFPKLLKELGIENNEWKAIVMAAGNVRILFEDRGSAQRLFEVAPKKIMQKAYGITLSQSIVQVPDTLDRLVIDRLEENLRSARNRQYPSLDRSLNAMYLVPRTALPAIQKEKVDGEENLMDRATFQKTKASRSGKASLLEKLHVPKDQWEKYPNDMSQMANNKGKIAVIHADGNGLGMVLQKIGERLEAHPEKTEEVFREFSLKLDEATSNAAERALKETFSAEGDTIRFRPVILGGDDLTVICDADRAHDFIGKFLGYFEEETRDKIGKLGRHYGIESIGEGLTACAGMTYCNEKFPFHYAVSLAEELCGVAKRESKNIDPDRPPSSLMFHNVQSSLVDGFDGLRRRELTLHTDRGDIYLDFGPYYLRAQSDRLPTLSALVNATMHFDEEENSPTGKLRNWLDILEEGRDMADLTLSRIADIAEAKGFDGSFLRDLHPDLSLRNLIVKRPREDGKEETATPIFDILQLHSISGSGALR